jgi:S-adenosylmethionine decarboxylase
MSEMHLESGLEPNRSTGKTPPSMFAPISLRTADAPVAEGAAEPQLKGYFIKRDGKSFAGSHLIVDFRDASHLDDIDYIEQTLIDAVNAAGASLLHIHLHHFTPGGGVSGVAVLAESHISIHTWPEYGFAALDVFMCGQCDPRDSIPVLERAFGGSVDVQEILRGEVKA